VGPSLTAKGSHVYNAEPPAPTERRRSPRTALPDGEIGIISTRSVRVVDISGGGVLLVSSRPAVVGTKGRLSFTVGGNPLAAEVEIRRVAPMSDRSGYRIGAMFLDITPAQRTAIQRLARP
jgi:hypothetical protein